MSDIGAPAKRGEDTPVPEGLTQRTVERRERPAEASPNDDLIPMSFVEQRARERASRPASYESLYVTAAEAAPPESVANPVAAGFRPLDQLPVAPGVPVANPLAGYPAGLYAIPPQGYPMQAPLQYGAGYATPMPHYAPSAHGAGYGLPAPQYAPPQYGYDAAPMMAPVPPREPWRPGQRAAAMWGSFVQHALFAIAVQVFVLGGLFLVLTASSWEGVDDVFGGTVPGTFTDFMVWLAKPENVALSAVLLTIVTVGLAVAGYFIGAIWQKHRGLQGRAKAYWLTAATGGSISAVAAVFVSPGTFILWVMLVLFVGNGGTMAGMWSSTFLLIFLGAIANGFICMGFGRLFLSNARPRVDYARLAAEAEARARAEDEIAMAGAADPDRFRISGT